ncbi:ABC transporter permease [Micromonospora sp. KC723]|uniref:ABC transporter permease n=1 Tax=Micromonospora sp. KC723 TaxID=2530381 RepID=UPI00104641E9|nr:ABC transporter permease [Micromonospora sp. KC723]TDB78353.1 ABC transporter permease [Micromonospora sp. KC723]
MNSIALTWKLARTGGRRGWQGQLLAAAAAAISVLILLLLLAVYLGAGTRGDHAAWRTPSPDPRGTAVQALSTTFVRGTPVTVVQLAQLPDRPATAPPPGLTDFSQPGEVYLSPALAALIRELPAGQLAGRFPRPASYHTIGRAGLASPDELIAVIGRTPADPAISSLPESDAGLGLTARAVVSGFARTAANPGSLFAFDQTGALMAVGLLVVPVLVLAAASGRLGAARREQRLAGLRLAGATPRQILAMTGAEAFAVGAAGAMAGAAAYGLLLPLVARVPYGVGAWYPGDLWVGPAYLIAMIVLIAGVIAVSAMSALRRVAMAPLGVARQADPQRTRTARLVVFLVAAGYIGVRASQGNLGIGGTLTLMLLCYGAYLTLGPWVVDRLGRIIGRFARRPAMLLAARRLSDDPRGAWRTVSGLVLAGFVAGFCSVAQLGAIGASYPGQVAVQVTPAEGGQTVEDLAAQARDRLRAAGLIATVQADPDDSLLWDSGIVAQITGGPAEIDTALTVLTGLVPGVAPYTQDLGNADITMTVRQLGQVGFAALLLGFLTAATSAGLTAAATVLDRRRTYRLLRLAGTPLALLNRARTWETAVPLVILAGGTTALGVFAATRLNSMVGTGQSTNAGRLAACVLVGAVAMFAAIGASRPLLRAVTADPVRADD